jgi:hypothetical protein
MKKWIVVSTVLIFFSLSPLSGNEFTDQLDGLRGLVNQWLPAEDRGDYLEFIDWLEEHHARLYFATTEQLLEAFLVEVISDTLEAEDDDAIDLFVAYLDNMRAGLFFGADHLFPISPEFHSDSAVGCTCGIFTRQVGPLTYVPGGLLYLQFADAVELEALLADDYGTATFDWDISAPNAILQENKGPRAYFRLIDLDSVDVKVTCNTQVGKCQDVLRIIVQGGTPTD